MQMVIELSDEIYEIIVKYLAISFGRGNGKSITYNLLKAIKNGTPLPAEHGDLKDVNDIWNNIPDVNVLTNHFTTYDIQHFIDNAPTIIEADKEERNNEQ